MNQSNQLYILIFYSSINLSIFYTSPVHPINQYLALLVFNQSLFYTSSDQSICKWQLWIWFTIYNEEYIQHSSDCSTLVLHIVHIVEFSVFFGLQYILKKWLVGQVLNQQMIDEAEIILNRDTVYLLLNV